MTAGLASLLAEGRAFEELELRSTFGFMAFHGGRLEVTTDRIARAAAERAGASYYGVLHTDDDPTHVPSTRFKPAESANLTAFVDHVDVVVTVHGFGRRGMFSSLLLGGRNRDLAHHVGRHIARCQLRVRGGFAAVEHDLRILGRVKRGQHHRCLSVSRADVRGIDAPCVELAADVVAECTLADLGDDGGVVAEPGCGLEHH